MKPIKCFIALALMFISANVFGQIVMPMDEGGGTPPTTPATPTKSSNTCGDVIVTRGTPPAGTVWYWQTVSNGTDLSNSSTTYTVSAEGSRTVYLRAHKPANGMWSAASSSVSVNVNPYPATPATPSVDNQCGQSVITRGTPPATPAGTTWYWQGTDPNGVSTANFGSTYTTTASGTYYLRARSAAGCWSSSVGVAVDYRPIPPDPANPLSSGNACGLVTLFFGGSPSGNVAWYWQTVPAGESFANGAASTFVVSTSGTYYLRARDIVKFCWSNGSGQVTVNVNLIPGNPTASGVTRIEPGAVTLSATMGANGTQVNWYSAPSGGTLLGTGLTYSTTVTGTTTFYVSSSNPTTGCESGRVAVTATVIPKPIITYTSLYFVMGNSVTLSVGNNTYSTYSWLKNGVAFATTPTVVISNQPGSYTVTVTETSMTGSGTSDAVTLAVADMNAIIVNNVRKIGFTTPATVESLPVTDRVKTVHYSGGLGNPIQTILSKGSPLQKDVIAPTEYDVLGRQLKGYLPYVSTTNDALYRGLALNNGGYTNSEQYQFYQTASKIETDTKPYSLAEVEPSPLQRGLAQTGVGNDWHVNSKKVTQQYLLNRATDAVRIWSVNTSGMPVSSATYPDYQLFISLTTDENGNRVKVYVDKLGRAILKEVEADATNWLRTYSIYDNFGRLAYTLSPEGTKVGNITPPQAFLDQWAFQYRYDNLNRLVEYKAPAGGWMYTVYDVLNRPVMTQNADQRSRSEWSFVKYDVNGRAAATGLKVIASSTRASVQTSVDAQTYLFELTATNAVGYTLTRTYPSAVEADLLSINYYDNYAFLSYSGWNVEAGLSFAFVAEQGSTAYETGVVGLATGAKMKILGSTAWLNAVQYYDNFYRPLQIIAENHLGGVDRNTNKYNDLRQLIETRLAHHNQSVIVLQKYNYDHAGRVTKIYHNINSASTDQLVAQYEYNEIGQLVDKKLHNTSGTTFLQSVDYRYNIRGWIASINNSQLNINSANNDETDDYFGMEFVYNRTESGLGNTVSHNGNISAIKWKGFGSVTGTTDQKSYKYIYDKADRLTTATSQMYTGAAWTKEANAINEAMTYDHNGNIKTLQRNHRKHQLSGIVASYISETVDNLTYTYSATQGNQLIKVEDAVAVGTGVGDFKNNVNVATEYTYNTDGALNADQNKGISSVTYNVLGKASIINFTDGRKIEYTYDAGGNKLKMKNFQGTTLLLTTDYLGGFVYENGALKFFGSPEGRVVKNGSAFEYQYSIADHQGNTRVVFTSATVAPLAPTATFEGDANDGASQYQNIVAGNVVSSVAANHTAGGTKVLRMNQAAKIAATKSLRVYPGDKVDIEAWEYHEGTSGFGTTSTPLTTLITMVSGAFGGVSGGAGESGLVYSGVNSAIGAFLPPGNQGSTRPAAYLNYILFDKNYKVLNMGWQLAPATTFTKQKLSFSTVNVKEAGFIFVYLSYDNDSNNWVYFDDLKVTHTKSNIIQYNEYYPFGLQASTSWTREGSSNNHLYNEGSELNQNSGWYETFFRGYDATLGRFHQVDPLAYASSSQSPYNYAYNNPVFYNDPNGDYPQSVWYDLKMGSKTGTAVDPFGSGSEGDFSGGQGGGYSYYHPSHMMGPSSGNHWSNQYNSVAVNFAMMSMSAFQSYYGVNFGTTSGQNFLANNLGTNFGGGLAGLTGAMIAANAVSYDAGTFTYQFGGKTYGGTYHTTNGVATSSATSQVVQSSSGGWVQIGSMEIHEFDGTSAQQGGPFWDGFLNPDRVGAARSNFLNMSAAANGWGMVASVAEYGLIAESKFAPATNYTSASTMRGQAAAGAKWLSRVGGPIIGGAGVIWSGIESYSNDGKMSPGEWGKLGVGGLMVGLSFTPLAPAVAAYALIDFAVGISTGYSITDRIGAGIDNSLK